VRGHRLATALILVAALMVVGGGWVGWRWYAGRPQPAMLHVTVVNPGVTPLADKLVPQPLLINFNGSAAPIEARDYFEFERGQMVRKPGSKPLSDGVRMEPALEGTWRWTNDRQLSFTPKSDWPADQGYEIKLERSLLAPHVLLDKYTVEARTAAFTASMPKLEFYTDPTKPEVKKVVATLQFSHRVEAAEVRKHLALAMIGETPVFPKGEALFTVESGKHQRIIYVSSASLALPEEEDFMRVTLDAKLATMQGGARLAAGLEKKVLIPNLYSFFVVKKASGMIVRKPEGEPEQIVTLETRGAAKGDEMLKALRVYLLPKKEAEKGEKDPKWSDGDEFTEEVLQTATLLPVKLIPSERETSDRFDFQISLEQEGQLYVTVAKGVHALGGFVLKDDYEAVLPVPKLPREIMIQGEGGVLALNGERKLSIKSRGVKTIEYEVARVPADQINHLVSQTRGEFQNPEFVNYHFGRENIARIAREQQQINLKSRFKANYSAFDFGKHLRPADDGGSALQGLFFLRAREWKEPKQKKPEAGSQSSGEEENADEEESDDSSGEQEGDSPTSDRDDTLVSDSRFVLVTDLGLIVKENTDGSRDVFIASIKSGTPLAEVSIEVLALNGVPLVSAKTGADGRVTLPSLGKPAHEKAPVAYVARLRDDVAFMPYARKDRQLDYSSFETGGVESRSGAELDAFVFTERGIYRPGDEIHVGLIVKQRNWEGSLEGLPVETEVIDAKGDSAQIRKLALPAMGFAETLYQTAYESPSGQWWIKVYLVHDGKRGVLLGETSVTVKEFLPDRMKIESRLSKDAKGGWITPEEVSAAITLRNLYGTPATGRQVKAHMRLSPAEFRFEEYRDYTFFDRLNDPERELKSQTVELGENKTDEEGATKFDLELERFADATYAVSFYAEGFEAGSGRSVLASNSALVSALPYVVGAKREGDFSYVPMGTPRAVEWVALDPALKKIAVDELECRLVQQVYVSVLSKQDDGTYAYDSVKRDQLIKKEDLRLPAEGLKYALPTEVPGSYTLELHEKKSDAMVGRITFTVVGRGAVTRSLEKNAELQVMLSKPQYNTGEEIEISVVAPYTGSGLITIERDKVYAHAWFKADRTSTVQRIRVPAELEGTGYVNVCFVRALDSKEVFLSPLSYAAAPFKANLEKRRLPIELNVAAKAKPGEPFRIGYKTDRPARIAIFAVDQGILQVSNYELPDPLAHCFRKAALMVQTKQIVDLILPEFSILRISAAFGGDAEKHLNPFKRVTEKPVVFWSGVLEAGPREQEVVYQVPDYFSGTLTVMAVAVAPDAIGSAEKNSLVRGPFVLTPSVPTMAAPGDEFDVSLTIANGVEGSGPNAQVKVKAEPSEHLQIVRAPTEPLKIAEGTEASTTIRVRALEKFGSATLVFRASGGGQEAKLRSTLSVRPATPFMTSVKSGNFTGESTTVKIDRDIHPDFRRLDATVSALPLGLARGLDTYLKNYPNGCSEQITSGAFCRLALAEEADFGLTRGEVNAQMERTFALLRRRQNDQGAFGYWAMDRTAGIDFVSTYVMHFLVEAKAGGFAPPANVLQSGLRHLQQMVVLEPRTLADARTQAYAIYLLTREGAVTTNYALNLRDYLQKNHEKTWKRDLAAVYLAGTYALLKKTDEAQKLIKGYELGVHDPKAPWSDFHSALAADSQYVAIVARHFPEQLKKISAAQFQAVTKPIGEGRFNTLSAAYAVMALKAYSQHLAKQGPELAMAEIKAGKGETSLKTDGSALLKRARFSGQASSLRFTAKRQTAGLGAFFQLVEAGYDTKLPAKAVSDGLEVYREFLDGHGQPTTTARLGEPVNVRLRIRSIGDRDLSNVAIVDLLPGGFEMTKDSLQPGLGSAGFDFVEVREDRVVFFGAVGRNAREVVYRLTPTNRGEFVIPPAFAESMYEPGVKGNGVAGRIVVEDAP
jgi:uncharacterized protein YfaS (alpha-2-macroglobulin family)